MSEQVILLSQRNMSWLISLPRRKYHTLFLYQIFPYLVRWTEGYLSMPSFTGGETGSERLPR